MKLSFVVTLYVLLQAGGHAALNYDRNNGFKDTDLLGDKRKGRTVLQFGKSILKGITATTRILKGSTPLVSPLVPAARSSNFVKPGTYDNALSDFLSVKPANVRNYEGPEGIKGKIGTIGDRTIIVENIENSSRGSLKIIENRGTMKERTKTIIYTEYPKYRKYNDRGS